MQASTFPVGLFGLHRKAAATVETSTVSSVIPVQAKPLVVNEADGKRWEFRSDNGQVVLTRFGRTGRLIGELRPTRDREFVGVNERRYVLGRVHWELRDENGNSEVEVLPVLSGFDQSDNLVSVEITEPVSYIRTEYSFEDGKLLRVARYYQQAESSAQLMDALILDAQGNCIRMDEIRLEHGKQVQLTWRCDSSGNGAPLFVGETVFRQDGSKESSTIRIPFPSDPTARSVNIVSEHDGICQTSIVHCAGYLISKTHHGRDGRPQVSIEYFAGGSRSYKYSQRELDSIGGRVTLLTKEHHQETNDRVIEATITTRFDRNGDVTVSVQNVKSQVFVLKRRADGTATYFKSPAGEWTSLDGYNWYRTYGLGKERQSWHGTFAIAADGTVVDGSQAGERDGFVLIHRTDGTTEKLRGVRR
jgi:hypothetical protein